MCIGISNTLCLSIVRRCDLCENVVAVLVLLKVMGIKAIVRCIS